MATLSKEQRDAVLRDAVGSYDKNLSVARHNIAAQAARLVDTFFGGSFEIRSADGHVTRIDVEHQPAEKDKDVTVRRAVHTHTFPDPVTKEPTTVTRDLEENSPAFVNLIFNKIVARVRELDAQTTQK